MTAEYTGTAEFRGARFTNADLSGLTARSCLLGELKIVDALLEGAEISGEFTRLLVNDVDVAPYVTAELDRRHPERVALREMRTADEHRSAWATLEQLWAETLARAERLPEPARHERVAGEWSFAETLRHLVFATDAWAARTVLDRPRPFHRLGLTHTPYPPAAAAELGIALDATPSYAEVLQARAERVALVRGIVEGLTDDELARPCHRAPAPGYPEEVRTVAHCLSVVMGEECEHRRYAVRDLAVLEAR